MTAALGILAPAGVLLLSTVVAYAQAPGSHTGRAHHDMTVDPTGLVMNENRDTLPQDCPEISQDYNFTVRAGREYSEDIPGMIFGMSQRELRVAPCSRIEVTFINKDDVRHQWMVHGLPKYLYPAGMFHIEATGGHARTGTLIVPGEDKTYLIHCDMAQHMEKGMRGQLVVGKGSGDLWGVAGVSDDFYRFPYLPRTSHLLAGAVFLAGFFATAWFAIRWTEN